MYYSTPLYSSGRSGGRLVLYILLMLLFLHPVTFHAQSNLEDLKFTGTYRKTSKISIVRMKDNTIAPYEHFSSLTKLMKFFNKNNDDAMRLKYPKISDVEPEMMRTPEELKNVEVMAYIYGAKFESDNDLHIILSSSSKAGKGVFLNTELSGLPDQPGGNYDTLRAARRAFLTLFPNETFTNSGYTKLGLKKVLVRGSIIFDADHHPGCKTCPGPKDAKPRTVWEIHPITGIDLVGSSGH